MRLGIKRDAAGHQDTSAPVMRLGINTHARPSPSSNAAWRRQCRRLLGVGNALDASIYAAMRRQCRRCQYVCAWRRQWHRLVGVGNAIDDSMYVRGVGNALDGSMYVPARIYVPYSTYPM